MSAQRQRQLWPHTSDTSQAFGIPKIHADHYIKSAGGAFFAPAGGLDEPGAEWVDVGMVKPVVGGQVDSRGLADALTNGRTEFGLAEQRSFGITHVRGGTSRVHMYTCTHVHMYVEAPRAPAVGPPRSCTLLVERV